MELSGSDRRKAPADLSCRSQVTKRVRAVKSSRHLVRHSSTDFSTKFSYTLLTMKPVPRDEKQNRKNSRGGQWLVRKRPENTCSTHAHLKRRFCMGEGGWGGGGSFHISRTRVTVLRERNRHGYHLLRNYSCTPTRLCLPSLAPHAPSATLTGAAPVQSRSSVSHTSTTMTPYTTKPLHHDSSDDKNYIHTWNKIHS